MLIRNINMYNILQQIICIVYLTQLTVYERNKYITVDIINI